MLARFAGKVALVTGGARGQGAEHARRYVAEGGKVVITDLLAEEGAAVAGEMSDAGLFIAHDVADDEGWREVMRRTVDFGGRLDHLVNNAGIARLESVADTSVESFEAHERVNQLGVFLGMKHAAPLMAARGGGSIVNVSSLGGLRGGGDDIAYVGTKWAVRGMTKSAAKEFGAMGIRVNSIHPGLVTTDMLSAVDPALLRERERRVPLRRSGTPRDIANLVLFLLSDEASYITGAEIVIDGGLGL